jgi:hypothetical protein
MEEVPFQGWSATVITPDGKTRIQIRTTREEFEMVLAKTIGIVRRHQW